MFGEIDSMKITFQKAGESNGSNFVNVPVRSSLIMDIKIDNNFCFLWSKISNLHPCEKIHPNRLTNYKQNFNELNNESFDFTNGFNCSDLHIFEKINRLSINIFELKVCQDQTQWKL